MELDIESKEEVHKSDLLLLEKNRSLLVQQQKDIQHKDDIYNELEEKIKVINRDFNSQVKTLNNLLHHEKDMQETYRR